MFIWYDDSLSNWFESASECKPCDMDPLCFYYGLSLSFESDLSIDNGAVFHAQLQLFLQIKKEKLLLTEKQREKKYFCVFLLT